MKKIGEVEVTRLNKKNLDYISRRSGQDKKDLENLMMVMKAQGRSPKMRYVVVDD